MAHILKPPPESISLLIKAFPTVSIAFRLKKHGVRRTLTYFDEKKNRMGGRFLKGSMGTKHLAVPSSTFFVQIDEGELIDVSQKVEQALFQDRAYYKKEHGITPTDLIEERQKSIGRAKILKEVLVRREEFYL